MTENYIVAAIFILYGAIAALKPEWLAKFQIWSQKVILGAQWKPSKRTYTFYRVMGVFFLVIAGIILLGWFE